MSPRAAEPAPGLTELIAEVVERSCKFWNAQDYRGLHDLWDPREAEPWYVAEELDAPLVGWAGIEAYWQASLGLAERDDLTFGNLQAKRLGADFALAIYMLRFLRKVAGPQQSPQGESRVTALFRRQGKVWRFCHLAESPLSPFLSMRRAFASDGEGPG